MTGIGPQYAGDSAFKARMRFHQSWYRARVLGVPCGTGPGPQNASRYGNMLTRGDGDRGLNFLTPEIFRIAQDRIEQNTGVVESFRMLCNMLSSQPMCFNLFGPLVNDRRLATHLARAILGDVRAVNRVLLEYAPDPAVEYLNDRTAFDAFIEYERADGGRGFVGIETKLTEPFSGKHYDGPAYRRWMQRADSPFLPEAWDRVDDVRHNQLWRDHLLAFALLRHPRSQYVEGRLALIHHPADEDCRQIAAGYRALLKPDDATFLDVALDEMVDAWRNAAPDEDARAWLSQFRLRYLDLAAGEEEWLEQGWS